MGKNLLENVDIEAFKNSKSQGVNLLPDYKPNFTQMMRGFADNPPPMPAPVGLNKIKKDVIGSSKGILPSRRVRFYERRSSRVNGTIHQSSCNRKKNIRLG